MTQLAHSSAFRFVQFGMASDKTPENFEPERTQGRRWVLATMDDTLAAAIEIAAVARRGLAILTPDLEPGVYDHERFLEIVKRLVLAKRFARIRVLISDPQRTIRLGNRLVGLGRRLNTYVEFRNVHEDYREHREAFLLADDVALLYRINCARWEGIADTYEPAVARRYLTLFEEIWAASETSRELRQLRV
ncbi:MAG: hypothetical protein ABI567_05050 [Gammaproteobacteria bacterium]